MQKKWIIVLAAAAGVIFMLIAASFVLSIVSICQSSAPAETQDTVTVYGQGVVTLEPDIAYVTLGYENYANSPQTAQDNNAAVMRQITAALKEAGVAEADIRESGFNIYQEYYYYDSADYEHSYCVSGTLEIIVRQLDQTTAVISAACSAGANITYGVTYDVADRQTAYAQALELARGRAEEKAAEMSEALGRGITGISQVQEYGAAQVSGDAYWDGYSGTLLTDYVAEIASPGSVKVTAVVYVTYRLE
jgi:Uncharacterized conserved protein